MIASVLTSMFDVASSINTILFFFNIAQHIQMSCFSPVAKF